MRKRSWLWPLIVISSIIVYICGFVIKYGHLRFSETYQEMHVVEIAMRFFRDLTERDAAQLHNPDPGIDVPAETKESVTIPEESSVPEEIITPMEDAWFDDVLFIGDSRTVGLRDMARSGRADYFCSVGMTVFDAMKTEASDVSFQKQKLETLLSSKSYGKIIITLGINECGNDLKTLKGAYQMLIEQIKLLQPDAKIILQSIMMVGRKKAAQASYFDISNLRKINEGIQDLSDGISIFYIDCNEAFTDEEGYLPDEMSSDGCHLYGKYDVQWEQWIRKALLKLIKCLSA